MPDAIAIEISDALAAGLSGHVFSAPYSAIDARRRYFADPEGQDLRSLVVSVVPGTVETERSSRGQDLFTHEVMIVLARHVDGTDAAADALMRLCEEIVDAIRSDLLVTPGMPENARYFGAAMATTFDRDALMDRRVFLGQINVTYRVPRDHVTAQEA
jgi:hypothetical protein